jgi:DNA-binding MarR family transcriptional regulator
MARHGLKAPHAIYLTALYRSEDGLTGPELCQRCGRDKSDVSRTLALLEEQGLVVKDLVNGSRYRGLLRLTQPGGGGAGLPQGQSGGRAGGPGPDCGNPQAVL